MSILLTYTYNRFIKLQSFRTAELFQRNRHLAACVKIHSSKEELQRVQKEDEERKETLI